MSNPDKEPTCAERWKGALDNTIEFLEENQNDPDELRDYGLSFDWKSGEDGEYGYFEWCLSWGGPADYLRFYVSHGQHGGIFCDQVDYSYQDWFDGETRTLRGDNERLCKSIFDSFWADIASMDPDFQTDQPA